MKILRGHHFSFSVESLEHSKAFYSGVLGLEEIDRPDFGIRGVWFQAGDTEVHLIEKPVGADIGMPPPALTPVANHSAFQIEDYGNAIQTLSDAGVEFIEMGPEAKQIFLRDPDGNIIELIEPGGRLGSLSPVK